MRTVSLRESSRVFGIVLWLCVACVGARPSDDEVKEFPGWNGPLPSRMYSGYVSMGSTSENGVSHDLFGHYVFVESETDPSNAPLLVWTNGGPGASSFFGLFVEFGPFLLSAASRKTEEYKKTGVPSLTYNKYSWSKVANILILNAPAPVGFSYCSPSGPSGNGYSCGTWNDAKAAHHNSLFLENWAAAWPEFLRHKWFLVGESYAGVYIPTLVRELLHNQSSVVAPVLEGFAVGDGCVGNEVLCGAAGPGPFFRLEFLHGHGQFSDKLFRQIHHHCPREQLVGYNGVQITDPTCKQLIDQALKQVGPYFPYNLYDDCWYQNDFSPPAPKPHPHGLDAIEHKWRHVSLRNNRTLTKKTPMLGGAVNDYACGGEQSLFEWVNTSAVKAALHVPHDAYFFSGDNGVGFTYNQTEANLLPFYQEVIGTTNLRVLVYNGDTDPGLNSFAAENWTSFLDIELDEDWRPWTIDGMQFVGGYVTRYKHDFNFLTIRGAGHMVPEFKPQVTLEFLSKWLQNKEWLHFTNHTPSNNITVDGLVVQ